MNDPDFGEIIVNRIRGSRRLRFQVTPSGHLKITAPKYASLRSIKYALDENRASIKRDLKIDKLKPASKSEIEALRRRAKKALTPRIESHANRHGFGFERLRFTTSSSNWGSCSSTGTISLNIAMMHLPDHLIDYVLLHELTHTEHPNHSADFWARLDQVCPGAKALRVQIRTHRPTL